MAAGYEPPSPARVSLDRRQEHRLLGWSMPWRTRAEVLAVILTVPMVAWMRFRRHGWRPSLEMGAATMGLGIVLIALGTIGVVPLGDTFEWVARLACPVMLVPMVARLNLYTGSMDHRAHAA